MKTIKAKDVIKLIKTYNYKDTDRLTPAANGMVKLEVWNQLTAVCNQIQSLPQTPSPAFFTGGDVPTTCSNCGHDWDEYVYGPEVWYDGSIPNYCPNCGAYIERK